MASILASTQIPPFRLAIIGAGLITQNSHLPTALSLPNISVTAIVDPVLDRANSLVTDYGLTARALTESSTLPQLCDGAIIATPNHTHASIAVPLLEAGVSTLIEKPLAATVAEGQLILDAAAKGKTVVAIGHYQRFLDAPRQLKRLLQSGYFGHVSRFYHQFGTAGGWAALSSYTLNRSAVGGGVLVVTGTHFLDRMLDLWGMPNRATLLDDGIEGPEGHCVGKVQYDNIGTGSLSGVIRYSKYIPLQAGLVLDTERGTVILRDNASARIQFIPRDSDGELLEFASTFDRTFPQGLNASQRMLFDFVTACKYERSPEVDGEQGLNSLRLIEQFYNNREHISETWASVQNQKAD